MKSWPDARSPWGKQLRFDDDEFEAMMDSARRRSGDCFEAGRGIDVDAVLLRSEGVEADYLELPEGILGRTKFVRDGSVQVEISRSLGDASGVDHVARRRLRSTLAHEVGHIACHRVLFVQDTESFSLFSDTELHALSRNVDPILCRGECVGSAGYSGEWWEYQANQCMASLLLPREMIVRSVREQLSASAYKDGENCLREGGGELLVRTLSDEYDVSHTLTLYRLQKLGFFPKGTQMMIGLGI